MWFKFPQGVEGISVERQEFSVEATDAAGGKYFRAPEHFASRILEINGFTLAGESLPEDAPADIPQLDPERDGAIQALSAANEALKLEVQTLRSDLNGAQASIAALTTQNGELTEQLHQATAKVEQLEEELTELHEAATTAPVK